MGRKRQTWETINGGTKVLLSQLDYNELGQLLTKHLHSETGAVPFLQDIGYTYNERGWLRTQGDTSNLFSLDLRYNTADNGTTQQYNGNIAEMLYTGTNSGAKTFQYQYDPLNRLISGVSTGNTLNESVSYDVMGNITSLTRLGGNAAVLAYTYQNSGMSNQLQSVTKGGSAYKSYAYDGNRNTTSDGETKSISYNLLNLPQSISTSAATVEIAAYDAQGNKLRTNGSDGAWDYINGIVYYNNAISFIQTEEGRALPNGSSYIYQYYLKDQLGNTRVAFKKNTNGTALNIQENEYYPFGLLSLLTQTSPANYYTYNGKEYERILAGYYDYGARFYDPVIARWTSVDPLVELGRRWSPYNYAENNPVKNIDPDGMAVTLGGGEYGGDLYTGADAQNLFKSLQTQYSQNNDGGKDKKNKDKKADNKKRPVETIKGTHTSFAVPLTLENTTAESEGYLNPYADLVLGATAIAAPIAIGAEKIRDKLPTGVQYTLRTLRSDSYPVYSWGKVAPTGSQWLNAVIYGKLEKQPNMIQLLKNNGGTLTHI